jgi:hypothetical protein
VARVSIQKIFFFKILTKGLVYKASFVKNITDGTVLNIENKKQ